MAAAPAHASDPVVTPGKIAKRLASVPFGGDMSALVAHVRKQLRSEYATRITETPDVSERDRLVAEIEVRVQAVRDSYVEFTGQKTGYNVSVVSDEFAHHTGEAMVVAQDGRSHDYFFFVGGALWKVVTTETTQRSFAEWLVDLTGKLGSPADVQFSDPKTRSRPTSARWDSETLVLSVVSRPDYGAVTLSFTVRDVGARIAKIRGDNLPPSQKSGEALDPSILDIMKD